jgi:hypothetical protein
VERRLTEEGRVVTGAATWSGGAGGPMGQGRPVLELRVVLGLHWDLLTRKGGPSGGLSTAAVVEEKLGNTAASSPERIWPALGWTQRTAWGVLIAVLHEGMGACTGDDNAWHSSALQSRQEQPASSGSVTQTWGCAALSSCGCPGGEVQNMLCRGGHAAECMHQVAWCRGYASVRETARRQALHAAMAPCCASLVGEPVCQASWRRNSGDRYALVTGHDGTAQERAHGSRCGSSWRVVRMARRTWQRLDSRRRLRGSEDLGIFPLTGGHVQGRQGLIGWLQRH